MEADVAVVIIGGISLLRAFAGSALYKVLLTPKADDVARYSRLHNEWAALPDPGRDPAATLAMLERVARRFRRRPVLIYGDDVMLLFVSRNRDKLARGFRFLMPEAGLIEACAEKRRFGRLAEAKELPVPRSFSGVQLCRAARAGAAIRFPLLLKPRLSTGKVLLASHRGRPVKAEVVRNRAELDDLLAVLGPQINGFIAQEYIEGTETEIYSYHAYADEQSRPLAFFLGHKLRTYPDQCGASTFFELVEEPELARLGETLLKKMQVRGPVEIEFKRDPLSGAYYVIEINLRYTLWAHLGSVCGVNLPQVAHAHLAGHPLPTENRYRTDVGWIAVGNDVRTFFKHYLPSGQLTVGAWLHSLMRPRCYKLFAWRDPLPYLIHTCRYLAQFRRKASNRIRARLALQS